MKSPPVRVIHCPLQARMADNPHPPCVSMRKSSRTVKNVLLLTPGSYHQLSTLNDLQLQLQLQRQLEAESDLLVSSERMLEPLEPLLIRQLSVTW